MKERIPDSELPQDMTPSEAAVGFSRQCINPSSPIPIYAVILQISERHRIKKVRFINPDTVVYSIERLETIPGHTTLYTYITDFEDVDAAISWAKLHADLDP